MKTNNEKNEQMILPAKNLKLMLIGVAVIIVGFLLMTGGGAAVFYFLILKPKRKPNVPDPLEEFDLEEEYYDETEDSL